MTLHERIAAFLSHHDRCGPGFIVDDSTVLEFVEGELSAAESRLAIEASRADALAAERDEAVAEAWRLSAVCTERDAAIARAEDLKRQADTAVRVGIETTKRADAAERARDEVGIQLAAAQAVVARMQPVVDAARGLLATFDRIRPYAIGETLNDEAHIRRALRALDTVPGDALAAPAPKHLPGCRVVTGLVSRDYCMLCKARTVAGDALVPPSPAGASAPASGSTPAASSVTSSGSEVEGSRCGQSGIDEVVQVVRDGVVYSATTARVLLDRIADPKMNDRPAVHVFDADVKGGE